MDNPADRAETAIDVSNLVKSIKESEYADKSRIEAIPLWQQLPRLHPVPWIAETIALEDETQHGLATPAFTSGTTAQQTAGNADQTGLVDDNDHDDQGSHHDNMSVGSSQYEAILEPPYDSVGARQAAGQLLPHRQTQRSKTVAEPPIDPQHQVWDEVVSSELYATSLTDIESQPVVRKDAAGNVPRQIKDRLGFGSVRACMEACSRYRQSALEISDWINDGDGSYDIDIFIAWVEENYPTAADKVRLIDSMTRRDEFNLPLEYKRESFSAQTLICTNRGDRHALDCRTYVWLLVKTGNIPLR